MPKDLKDNMKKLRKRAYEKSKPKDIGRFGEDEFLKQDRLPGMKKGGMLKDVLGDKKGAVIYKGKAKDYKMIIPVEPPAPKPDKKKMGGEMKSKELKGGQKKLDVNKDGKISGEDFKILRGKKNKMRGGGIAIKGTNFKGVY